MCMYMRPSLCICTDLLCLDETARNTKKSIDQLRQEVEAIFNKLYGMYIHMCVIKCNDIKTHTKADQSSC